MATCCPPPWTDACQNITFPQLCLRAAIKFQIHWFIYQLISGSYSKEWNYILDPEKNNSTRQQEQLIYGYNYVVDSTLNVLFPTNMLIYDNHYSTGDSPDRHLNAENLISWHRLILSREVIHGRNLGVNDQICQFSNSSLSNSIVQSVMKGSLQCSKNI